MMFDIILYDINLFEAFHRLDISAVVLVNFAHIQIFILYHGDHRRSIHAHSIAQHLPFILFLFLFFLLSVIFAI